MARLSKDHRFLAKAEVVTSAIQAELGRDGRRPGEQPTTEQLEAVLRRIEAMRRQIEEDSAPPKHARYRSLSRMLVDEWPLGHSLANEITELEDLYVKA